MKAEHQEYDQTLERAAGLEEKEESKQPSGWESQKGWGLTRRNFLNYAFTFAAALGIPHPFSQQNKRAGDFWLRGFLLRNNDVSLRKAEQLSWARASGFNKEAVNRFYQQLSICLPFIDFDPDRCWNMDETGTAMNVKGDVVFAKRGTREVHRIVPAERGCNVTCIATCNAAGKFLSPCLIFKGKQRRGDGNNVPDDWNIYYSKSGYTNSDLFLKFLEGFHNSRKSDDLDELLILDGHVSHFSVSALSYCREKRIHMLVLPPHCSHRLQPLDISVFKALKSYFNTEANSWHLSNPKCSNMTRSDFESIFVPAWSKIASNADLAIHGFESTGILPFNPNRIDTTCFAISENILNARKRAANSLSTSFASTSCPTPSTSSTPASSTPSTPSTPSLIEYPIDLSMPKRPLIEKIFMDPC